MQLIAPRPSLSKGNQAHPLVSFGVSESAEACSALSDCWAEFFRETKQNQGTGFNTRVRLPEKILPLAKKEVAALGNNLYLIPFQDFSAILYRNIQDLPHTEGEVFYHPLQLSNRVRPLDAVEPFNLASPQILLNFLCKQDLMLGNLLRSNIDEIVDFWGANPTFDVRVNEDGPTNMAWAMPLYPCEKKTKILRREAVRVMASFPDIREIDMQADALFTLMAGRLKPDGTVKSAHLSIAGKMRINHPEDLLRNFEDWVISGLSSPCCPVPLQYQAHHSRPHNWIFDFLAEREKLTGHEVFETRARMKRLLQE